MGSAGLTKNGIEALTLSGKNSGRSGSLTTADVASTNNAGVVVTSHVSLGAVSAVTVDGGATSGGYFRLAGTAAGGITVPSSFTFNFSGAGGNGAPAGNLFSGGTGVNTIQGPANTAAHTMGMDAPGTGIPTNCTINSTADLQYFRHQQRLF